NGERLELARLNLAQHRGNRVEQYVDLLAEDRGDRLGRGAERHVQDVDVGGLPEQLAGEMLRGAEAGAGEGELAGIGFGGGDQLLDVIGREVRARDDDQAGGCNLRHRIERGERVVAQRLVHDRSDDL